MFDLEFEFRKSQDENIERVATAIQRVSWVKILGHGVARVNRLPLFLEDIMKKMEPRTETYRPPEDLKELYSGSQIVPGKILHSFTNDKHFLKELKIQTTLEESNLVGNVYFANYSIWIGRVTDYYFYSIWPELYLNESINNEFICTQLKIDHLNEAMPFDAITIRLYLSKILVNGLILKYEIYANNSKRLAIATQTLIWINRDKLFQPVIDNLPKDIINKIIG